MDEKNNTKISQPLIRIIKIGLENFKNIKKGSIVFPAFKDKTFIYNQDSTDLLGIYGQNGTGKTSLLQALNILKYCLSGKIIPAAYVECISADSEYAKLTFTFDYFNDEEDFKRRIIEYSFKIVAIPDDNDPDDNNMNPAIIHEKIKICDEIITSEIPTIEFKAVNGREHYVKVPKSKKQEIINSKDSKLAPFGPLRKIICFVSDYNSKLAIELMKKKYHAQNNSRSPIFCNTTMDIFSEHSDNSPEYQILFNLKRYAENHLFVADTRLVSMTGYATLVLNTCSGIYNIVMGAGRTNTASDQVFNNIVESIGNVSTVLEQIIPGLTLIIQETTDPFEEDSIIKHRFSLLAKRDGSTINLYNESAGIIRLISILPIFISAFNDKAFTVAIDEFDAGIFEFLIGELLSLFKERGKGQLLFTSHNLRPLEVLNKENIVFSTANPENRFIKFTGVAPSNNLRNMYLKEVLSGTQKEVLYESAKRYKLYEALRKAGT